MAHDCGVAGSNHRSTVFLGPFFLRRSSNENDHTHSHAWNEKLNKKAVVRGKWILSNKTKQMRLVVVAAIIYSLRFSLCFYLMAFLIFVYPPFPPPPTPNGRSDGLDFFFDRVFEECELKRFTWMKPSWKKCRNAQFVKEKLSKNQFRNKVKPMIKLWPQLVGHDPNGSRRRLIWEPLPENFTLFVGLDCQSRATISIWIVLKQWVMTPTGRGPERGHDPSESWPPHQLITVE